MYTYKLGGMLITDELYHDDLEAMTFGRKDQNELMHYGIKGQSWGKRRFQNEDGSLTMAGRNRYDVGDSRQGVSAFTDAGRRGGSGVNYNRLPGGTGGSTRSATANQAPARLVGSNPRGRATTSTTTTQKVANTTNAGRKAADSLFGRIGNWASNAAKDVSNFATNTYNDASKAVGNAANAAGSLVGNAVKGVGNLLSNEDEKKAAENAQNRANQALNNAINRSGEYVPDGRGGEDLYIRDANDAKMVDTAEQQAAKAQQRYDDHPVTQVQNAAKSAGNWVGNAFNDAKNWVGDRAQDVGNAASSAFNDAKNWAGNAANDVGNFVNDNYNRAREAVNGAAGDIGRTASNAFNDAKTWAGNAANNVGNFVKNAPQNISDWYTGDKAGREAQRYDNVVQNFERNGERNINEGVDKISDSIDKDIDRINIDLHGNKGDSSAHYAKNRDDLHDASNKQFWEGLNQRNLGYDQHDIAGQYGQKADEAQARYDAAPRQLLNAAGNWIGDRVSDAGNAVGNVLKPGINAVGNAVRDAGNWVGDAAKNIYDDVDYRLYSLGQDIAEPAKNRAWQDFQNRIAQDREIYNREFPSGDYQTWKSASNRIDDAFKDYQRESNKIEQNPIGSAINNVGRSIGEGVQKAGDWASNAASDVRDWGAGAIDKGKTAVSNFFSELVNPHYNLNVNDMKSRYEEILAELPKGDIARIRYYGNSQGDQDALREQAIESIKRGR